MYMGSLTVSCIRGSIQTYILNFVAFSCLKRIDNHLGGFSKSNAMSHLRPITSDSLGVGQKHEFSNAVQVIPT